MIFLNYKKNHPTIKENNSDNYTILSLVLFFLLWNTIVNNSKSFVVFC